MDDKIRIQMSYYLQDICPTTPTLAPIWEEIQLLNAEAREYTQNSSERDIKWEQEFAAKYELLQMKYSRQLTLYHSCEEWKKVINGRYTAEALEGEEYALHILRLAKAEQINKNSESVEEDIQKVFVPQPDAVQAEKEQPTQSVKSAEMTPQTNSVTSAPTAADVNGKSEKKTSLDKKISGSEKRKDDTGIEES